MYSESRLPYGAVLWRSADNAGGAFIPADGCVDLILREGRVQVAGPSTRRIASGADGDGGSQGLRLPPGRAGRLLHADLNDIADQLIPLDDLVDRDRGKQLRNAMTGSAGSPNLTFAMTSIAAVAGEASHWANAVRRASIEMLPASTVAAELGESDRSFRRRMLRTFGYGYATLVRLERGRRARALLKRGSHIGVAAAAAGFADQSHLTREFQRLVGMSPRQFAARSA